MDHGVHTVTVNVVRSFYAALDAMWSLLCISNICFSVFALLIKFIAILHCFVL